MRQRITFLQEPQDSVDPASLKVTSNSLIADGPLKATREDRITFPSKELPHELQRLLGSLHELHIKWASERSYTAIPPFISRLSPGFHAFYTPLRNGTDSYVDYWSLRKTVLIVFSDLLCPTLKNVFGEIDCESVEVWSNHSLKLNDAIWPPHSNHSLLYRPVDSINPQPTSTTILWII